MPDNVIDLKKEKRRRALKVDANSGQIDGLGSLKSFKSDLQSTADGLLQGVDQNTVSNKPAEPENIEPENLAIQPSSAGKLPSQQEFVQEQNRRPEDTQNPLYEELTKPEKNKSQEDKEQEWGQQLAKNRNQGVKGRAKEAGRQVAKKGREQAQKAVKKAGKKVAKKVASKVAKKAVVTATRQATVWAIGALIGLIGVPGLVIIGIIILVIIALIGICQLPLSFLYIPGGICDFF